MRTRIPAFTALILAAGCASVSTFALSQYPQTPISAKSAAAGPAVSWTQELGNAVLTQRGDVMDAVQRMRQEAYNYGYLQNSPYLRVVVAGPGDIEILPVTPGYYYVPYYNPAVVFVRPRPGVYVGGAIRFGPMITVGAAFAPWGWGGVGFGWHEHTILVDHRPWVRTWTNRGRYIAPYTYRRPEGPRVEHHEVRPGPERHDYRDHDHH